MSEDRTSNISDSWAKEFPRRFYEQVDVEETDGGFSVTLDGRQARTPNKTMLDVPRHAIARAIADEYAAQGEQIVPGSMPLTRLVNSAIDTVAASKEQIAGEVASYAGSDLLCYRAETPQELVQRQCEHWDELLAWARDEMGVALEVTSGIMHVTQPVASIERVRAIALEEDIYALSALHMITTISGSAVLSIAVARGHTGMEAAWTAAHVDEDWQIEQWGEDSEAQRLRQARHRDFAAACRLIVELQRSG